MPENITAFPTLEVVLTRGKIRTVWRHLQNGRFYIMANVADRLLKLHYSETLLETLVMACFMNSMFIPKQMKMISPFFFQNIDGTSFGIWYFLTIKERLAS